MQIGYSKIKFKTNKFKNKNCAPFSPAHPGHTWFGIVKSRDFESYSN